MSRWALGRGATLSLLVVGTLIVSLASLLLRETRQLAEANAWVRHTLEVLMSAQELRTSIATAESASRGYAIIGDDRMRASFERAAAEVPQGIDRLRTLTSHDPEQRTRAPSSRGRPRWCGCGPTPVPVPRSPRSRPASARA